MEMILHHLTGSKSSSTSPPEAWGLPGENLDALPDGQRPTSLSFPVIARSPKELRARGLGPPTAGRTFRTKKMLTPQVAAPIFSSVSTA